MTAGWQRGDRTPDSLKEALQRSPYGCLPFLRPKNK
jgi:hypothetical protein